jgi:hypothetical protein
MPSERVQKRIDGLLDDAEMAAARRDWEEVAQSLRMVLRLDAENAAALSFEAMLEGEVGDETEAGATLPPLPAGEAKRKEGEGEGSTTGLESVSTTPTSFANDRYQVSKFLGRVVKNASTRPTTPCSTARSPSLS